MRFWRMAEMVMTFERLTCRVINQIDLDPVFRLIYGRAEIRIPRWIGVSAKECPSGVPGLRPLVFSCRGSTITFTGYVLTA